MLLFIIFQITFDESFTAPFWSDRLHEILFLPPLSPYSKILWGQGIFNTLCYCLFSFFFREKLNYCCAWFFTFVVAEFAPAFANFHRIEPLLLLDQVFIGFCLQFCLLPQQHFALDAISKSCRRKISLKNHFQNKRHSNKK